LARKYAPDKQADKGEKEIQDVVMSDSGLEVERGDTSTNDKEVINEELEKSKENLQRHNKK